MEEAERMDAVDRAGITAFYASTPSEPARQLILVVILTFNPKSSTLGAD
jgi:hypothetical protein